MLQTTSRSVSAEPEPSSTPSSFPHSTFSAAGAPQLTPPPSASITPATTFSNPPAASGSNSAVLTADPGAASKRIADLTSTVHQLNQDNVRQISSTNELLNNKLFGQMIALVEERDGDKAARKAAEDRLAEVVASRAKAEEVLLKEREERRKAKSAWSRAYYALEKENTDLQGVLLDMQAKTDFLQVEALQEALVRLGIVDPDDQQYPLAYPVYGDCVGPFLKAVCTAVGQGPQTNSNGGPEHELATAAHRTSEAHSVENGCLELVSDKRTGARSSPPAPAEWLKSGSTRTRRSTCEA
ncbi:hypothetical protein FRC04_011504 [Tulasnella sp. 424]|nr:hypothetical protein FRC04_011504 [Tulasnella sp. 424]